MGKLGGFGLATKLDGSELLPHGDGRYLSPEVLGEAAHNLAAADVFALGMSLYQLARQIELPILCSALQDILEVPGFSTPFCTLVQGMTTFDVAARLTVSQVFAATVRNVLSAPSSSGDSLLMSVCKHLAFQRHELLPDAPDAASCTSGVSALTTGQAARLWFM